MKTKEDADKALEHLRNIGPRTDSSADADAVADFIEGVRDILPGQDQADRRKTVEDAAKAGANTIHTDREQYPK